MKRLLVTLVCLSVLALVATATGQALPGYCKKHPERQGCQPPPPPPARCANGLDDDGDGLVDLADPGCDSSADDDESNPAPPPPPPPAKPRFTWTKSSGVQAEFDKVKSLGFTHAMVDPDPAQMARVAAAGLRIVFWGGNYSDSCAWNWSDATFTAKVNNAKTSPHIGLVDYVFIADEPHGPGSGRCPNSPADLAARNSLSKQLLPGAQTMVSENRKEDWPYVAKIADVFLPIIYPCSYANGCVPSKIDEGVALMNSLAINNYWATVQSFTEPPGGYYRAPSASEEQALYDRWDLVADPAKRSGTWNYAWGDGCCGDDIGLRDLPGLQPVVLSENTGG
jgi:hypothetical protein